MTTTTSILLLTSFVTCVGNPLLAAPPHSLLIGLHAPANTSSPNSSSHFVFRTIKATTIPSPQQEDSDEPIMQYKQKNNQVQITSI